MKRRITRVFCLIGLLFMLGGIGMTVQAAGKPVDVVIQPFNREAQVNFSHDIIVTKYRTYKGKAQYRNWNETQGCWVEDDWITMSK